MRVVRRAAHCLRATTCWTSPSIHLFLSCPLSHLFVMVLYYIVRGLFHFILNIFFRDIEVVGIENVPLDNPVILVGMLNLPYIILVNTLTSHQEIIRTSLWYAIKYARRETYPSPLHIGPCNTPHTNTKRTEISHCSQVPQTCDGGVLCTSTPLHSSLPPSRSSTKGTTLPHTIILIFIFTATQAFVSLSTCIIPPTS